MDYLDYFNFLEALVRVCLAKPWKAEDEGATFDAKLEKMINAFEDKFGEQGQNLVVRFLGVRKHTNQQEMYQPRVVRDDDDGDGSDSEDA